MPTYEYACRACDEHLEVVQSFKDDPLTVCPNCAGTLRKVFAPIGIAFKGSGFYKTDSRPAPKEKSSSTSSESKSESSGKADSKSEPSGKSDSKPSDSKPASSGSSEKKSEKKSSEAKTAAS